MLKFVNVTPPCWALLLVPPRLFQTLGQTRTLCRVARLQFETKYDQLLDITVPVRSTGVRWIFLSGRGRIGPGQIRNSPPHYDEFFSSPYPD